MTDEQAQEAYKKLKKIDEFAKGLGVIIYKINISMEIGGQKYEVETPIFGNKKVTE